MTEHIFRKFPDHIDAIQGLLKHSAAFREMCDDYEEICTWLTFHDTSETRSPKETDHAREVIRSLEAEIIKALREAGIAF